MIASDQKELILNLPTAYSYEGNFETNLYSFRLYHTLASYKDLNFM